MTHFALGTSSNVPAAVTGGYESRAVITANKTNYTFSAQGIGTAASDRLVAAAISYEGSFTVSGVTIGGITATKVASLLNSVSEVSIWTATVTSGTTGDIVVSGGGASSSCGVSVYALYGANTTAMDSQTSSANPTSVTLNIPANGFALGLAVSRVTGTCTWTGLTERFDEAQEAGNPSSWSGADTTTAGSSTSITADWTSESSQDLVCASWQPA